MRQHLQAWFPPRASLNITGGAQHLRDDEPPAGWSPPGPVGFVEAAQHLSNAEAREPLTWDGDQA